MKKIFIALLLSAVSLGASAQFEKGTKYVGASVSGFGLSYSKIPGFCLDLQAIGGYFISDGIMLLGQFGWEHRPHENDFDLGIAGRYYLQDNGLYFNGGFKYEHVGPHVKSDNFYLTPEVGYCFYLNDHVSIEPAVYCDMCLNHFKNFTKIGLKIGFGYYF